MGYTFQSNRTFNSIPGLTVWVDPKKNVTRHAAPNTNRIKEITDLSGYDFKWGQGTSSVGTLIEMDDSRTVMKLSGVNTTTPTLKPVASNSSAPLAFLTNGSPFSIYYIFKVTFGATGSSNHFTPITGGIQVAGNPFNGTSGRFVRFRVVNSVGTPVLDVTTSAVAYNYSAWTLGEINHKGYNVTGHDCEIYLNDVLRGTGNYTGAPDRPANFLSLMHCNMSGSTGMVQAILIYDHTGKTETEINMHRQMIRELITKYYSL